MVGKVDKFIASDNFKKSLHKGTVNNKYEKDDSSDNIELNNTKKKNTNKNWKKDRQLRKRKARFQNAALGSDTFKKARDDDDILYKMMILKWLSYVSFCLKSNCDYSEVLKKEKINRFFMNTFALRVDVCLEDVCKISSFACPYVVKT